MMENTKTYLCSPAGEDAENVPHAYEHCSSEMKSLKNHLQDSNAPYDNNLPSKNGSKLV